MNEIFEQLDSAFENGGTEATLEALANYFSQTDEYHQLFEVRKMQIRHRLGIPLMYNDNGDQLDEATQKKLEDELVDACREVGNSLLDAGNVREGWLYLRPVGEREQVLQRIKQIEVDDENLEAMIEVLLHEGLDVERGYGLVLSHYGTCNAITTFDSAMHGRSKAERSVAARALLDHVYAELRESVANHIEQEKGSKPTASLVDMIHGADWLLENGTYHIDATHLASAVRIARDVEEPSVLQKAWELTQYGKRLDTQLQYPGDEPFADLYLAHEKYFEAQLGTNTDEALSYFAEKARATDAYEMGTMPIEVYINLLDQLGKYKEAISATIEMIPEGTHTTGYAPTLLELSQRASDYEQLRVVCRERKELLGYTLGLLQAKSR